MHGVAGSDGFGHADIEHIAAGLTQAQLDRLTFGAIQLDAAGKILRYNSTEGDITGTDPVAAIGKNFFDDVAPCTNTLVFRGAFDAGVAAGSLNALIDYTFTLKLKSTRVRVRMKSSTSDNTYWIFVAYTR